MSFLKLLYWLGPWTPQERAPEDIERHPSSYRSRNEVQPLWIYRGKDSKWPLFLVPGIQHQGPADPRLDRFARVLAHAGYVVGVPALPTMIDLRMEVEVIEDVQQAFLGFAASFVARVAVFSISASSIAALHLGVVDRCRSSVSQIMLFGGYRYWSEALIFAMDGWVDADTQLQIDPLNLPVVLLNVIEGLPLSEGERAELYQAWHRFVCVVWENPNYTQKSAYQPVAEQLASALSPELCDLFLQGCSVKAGGIDLAKSAIQQCARDTDWLDPKPVLTQLQCPLHIAHGREDVVVPYTHAQQIAELVPQAKVYVTGLAHHAGVNGISHYLGQLPNLLLELVRSIGLLRAMARLWHH